MILHIDTKDQKQIRVDLKKEGKIVASMAEENEYGSQVLLPLVMRLMELGKLKFSDLENIEVETGPGSFTGLKVGVSVANALGFSLGIPVNGKRIETDLVY